MEDFSLINVMMEIQSTETDAHLPVRYNQDMYVQAELLRNPQHANKSVETELPLQMPAMMET